MKRSYRRLLFALGLCVFAVPAQARHHHHGASALHPPPPEPPPLAAEAVPKISPDAPPSESL